MSYLYAQKRIGDYLYLGFQTTTKPANDTTSGLFPAVKTHNTGNGNFSGLLSNVTLKKGRTYYVKVKFRTRGDGTSTSNKCSSVGFITYWNSWANTRSYIHSSATAYSEIGKIVEWTYSFTVDSDVTPTGTGLYFIINNGWASGNDGQTIDLFYYKYWDSAGNVYNESGTEPKFLKVTKNDEVHYVKLYDSGIIAVNDVLCLRQGLNAYNNYQLKGNYLGPDFKLVLNNKDYITYNELKSYFAY